MINQSFFVRDEGKYVRLNLSEILIIVTDGNYIRFFGVDYMHLVRGTLEGTLSLLPEGMFARTHKSFAVSLLHLLEVEKEQAIVGNPNFKEIDKGAIKVDAHYLQETTETSVNIRSIAVPVAKQYYTELVSKLTVINKAQTKVPQPGATNEP